MQITPPDATALSSSLGELAEIVRGALPQDGTRNLFESLWVSRASTAAAPAYSVYDPVFCLVAQGSKRVTFGDECAVYDTRHYLLNTVALPASSVAIDATPTQPFLSLSLVLDPATLKSVIVDAGLREPDTRRPLRAMETSRVDTSLLESVLRLARLAQSPRDIPFLGPLALREVVYRLLTGEQGARLYEAASLGGQMRPIAQAITWMRANFHKPLRIETLAGECGLSPSSLHHHFKSVTAMSPLQFQKQLRLQEARRLMLADGLDAAGAGYRVGYEDAAYFNRDYKRFFGLHCAIPSVFATSLCDTCDTEKPLPTGRGFRDFRRRQNYIGLNVAAKPGAAVPAAAPE